MKLSGKIGVRFSQVGFVRIKGVVQHNLRQENYWIKTIKVCYLPGVLCEL